MVKVFGEMEFWFAIIKVIAVVAMIIFGAWLLFSGNGGPQASVSNLWDQGGFLPHGFTGLVMMMAIIMFSFGGLELVGITAAEADNPEQSIPPQITSLILRPRETRVTNIATPGVYEAGTRRRPHGQPQRRRP